VVKYTVIEKLTRFCARAHAHTWLEL